MPRFKFLIAQRLIAQLPATRMFKTKLSLLRWAGVTVGENTRIHSRAYLDTEYVEIGENVWIGAETFIGGNPNARVIIGDNVDIAPKVMIITGSHEIGGSLRRAGTGYSRGVTIGDGTWLGAGSLILPGIIIGSGSIVAAGAVVTKDIPPNAIAAGVPARVLRDVQP
ncbi:acyltransferase [Deinococcus yunweiensis]|uniref:acyltransferase n=1 Tax=Deinococcus yunweiensis TaxID=367282 RepID=UPI00398EA5C2